jgi:hypothetical protein
VSSKCRNRLFSRQASGVMKVGIDPRAVTVSPDRVWQVADIQC